MPADKELIEQAHGYIAGWRGENDLRVGPNMLVHMVEQLAARLEALTRPLEGERAAVEPFLTLAREVINPANGERPWHADSEDWMVVFSFAGQSLTLGDLRRAAALSPSPEAQPESVAWAISTDGPHPIGQHRRWRPIETAPKDGTRVLAWPGHLAGGVTAAVETWWYEHPSTQGWITDAFDCGDYEFAPTCWAPLPPPPQEQGGMK